MHQRLPYSLEKLVLNKFNLTNEMLAGHKLSISESELGERGVRMRVSVDETTFGTLERRSTRSPLDINIKRWLPTGKKGSIVCSNYLFYDNKTADPASCGGSRRASSSAMTSLCWTSSAGDAPPTTYPSNFDLFYNDDYPHESDLFKLLISNQCLMDNIDKYERVSVQDYDDELLIPPPIVERHDDDDDDDAPTFVRDSHVYEFVSEFEMTNVHDRRSLLERLVRTNLTQCASPSTSPPLIDAYVHELERAINRSRAQSFYFHTSNHLSDAAWSQVSAALESYFASDEFKQTKRATTHNVPLTLSTLQGDVNFTLTLHGEKDDVTCSQLPQVVEASSARLKAG